MKALVPVTAIALGLLAAGCVTRVVYRTPPPPPPYAPSVVVQGAPPPGPPPAAPADGQPAPAAAPQASAPVAVQPPPPAAPPAGYVPDYYVWDGYEYVGVYGDQYVYWTGGAWIVCDPVIIGRFHGWERYHPSWRGHAFHYYRGRERYH